MKTCYTIGVIFFAITTSNVNSVRLQQDSSAFGTWDIDDDGYIDKGEVRKVFAAHGLEWSEAVGEMLDQADGDGSGGLDRWEFEIYKRSSE